MIVGGGVTGSLTALGFLGKRYLERHRDREDIEHDKGMLENAKLFLEVDKLSCDHDINLAIPLRKEIKVLGDEDFEQDNFEAEQEFAVSVIFTALHHWFTIRAIAEENPDTDLDEYLESADYQFLHHYGVFSIYLVECKHPTRSTVAHCLYHYLTQQTPAEAEALQEAVNKLNAEAREHRELLGDIQDAEDD